MGSASRSLPPTKLEILDERITHLLAEAALQLDTDTGHSTSHIGHRSSSATGITAFQRDGQDVRPIERRLSHYLLSDVANPNKPKFREIQSQAHTDSGKRNASGPASRPAWSDLPRTDLTPELKRDLQLLHMRNVLDPKRHFKKAGKRAKAPEFSQTGTLVEGATEFYNSRVPRRHRKETLTAELLANSRTKGHFIKKYQEIQALKRSGRKAHYESQKRRRSRTS